jgi:hypothetical protein
MKMTENREESDYADTKLKRLNRRHSRSLLFGEGPGPFVPLTRRQVFTRIKPLETAVRGVYSLLRPLPNSR